MSETNNEKTYLVYMHISPNNKRYIGITSHSNPKRRWKGGYGYHNNEYFYRAIKKYGWDNFQHEIIASNLSKDDACKMEIDLIEKYHTRQPKFGYNYSSGGETSKGCGKLYTAFGKDKTLGEWADEYNIEYSVLHRRVTQNKIPLEDALLQGVKNVQTLVYYNGEIHNLSEWAKIIDVRYSTLVSRYDRGVRGEKLFRKSNKRNIFVTYNNETHTLKEWSDITQIPYETLRDRYHKQNKRGEELFHKRAS